MARVCGSVSLWRTNHGCRGHHCQEVWPRHRRAVLSVPGDLSRQCDTDRETRETEERERRTTGNAGADERQPVLMQQVPRWEASDLSVFALLGVWQLLPRHGAWMVLMASTACLADGSVLDLGTFESRRSEHPPHPRSNPRYNIAPTQPVPVIRQNPRNLAENCL